MPSIVLYLLSIVACGGVGAVLGWAVAGLIGLTGTPQELGALLTSDTTKWHKIIQDAGIKAD